MTIEIRSGRSNDIKAYTKMMQASYEDAYVSAAIGLTKKWLSVDVFNSADSQEYLRSKLVNTENHRSWIAVDGSDLIGGVTAEIIDGFCEMSGFYVLPSYQGRGVGKKLFGKVLEFAQGSDIHLDTYTHNKKTIKLYKHWGFEEDTTRSRFYRHWTDWPENLRAECMYMIRRAD